MSNIHELTLKEYYESFCQSLIEGEDYEAEDKYEIMIEEHLEPEIIYLGDDLIENCEVIEILGESDSELSEKMNIKSPKKSLTHHQKVEDPKNDPLMLAKSKSLKAYRRNEDDSITRRVTRSCRKL